MDDLDRYELSEDGTTDGEGGAQQSLAARVSKSVGLAVLAVLLALATLHVVLPPVRPKQETAKAHPGGACPICHVVSESAALIEVD